MNDVLEATTKEVVVSSGCYAIEVMSDGQKFRVEAPTLEEVIELFKKVGE